MSEQEARKKGRPRAFHENLDAKVVQSLDKAMVVLKAVAAHSGLSLTQLSEITEITSPTVYRALITMQQHGMVTFDEDSQLWTIGLGAFRIGSSFLRKTSIIEQARPVMKSLMLETGETANLGIMEDHEIVFLSQAETHQPIRAFHRPGSKGTFYASGIGKILFAYLDERSARRLLSSVAIQKYTDKTITDIDQLIAHRKEMRAQGYAFDDEERMLGMRCVAAPIFDIHGEAVAALSISGPSVRIPDSAVAALAEKVKNAAALITENSGGIAPGANDI